MCRHMYDWNIVNCDVKQQIHSLTHCMYNAVMSAALYGICIFLVWAVNVMSDVYVFLLHEYDCMCLYEYVGLFILKHESLFIVNDILYYWWYTLQ